MREEAQRERRLDEAELLERLALVAQDDDSGCLSTACSNDKWGAVSYTITQLQDKDGNTIANNLFDIKLGAANTAQITIMDIGTSEIRDMNKVSGCVEPNPGVSKTCENREYTLKVTATDGFERPVSAASNGYGLLSNATNVAKTSNTATITVTLTEQNDAPVMVCPSTLTIDENTKPGSNVVSGVITASDQEGDAIAYSITSGNDLDAFSVVGSAGGTKGTILVNKDVINFEGGRQVYSLAIKAEDQVAQPLSSSCTVTINVNDLNEGPLLADVALSVTENSAAGVQVGSTTMLAVSSDVDAADNVPKALQFSIVPDPVDNVKNSAFVIEPDTGVIRTTASAIDYEKTPSFALAVRVTDHGDLKADAAVTTARKAMKA